MLQKWIVSYIAESYEAVATASPSV